MPFAILNFNKNIMKKMLLQIYAINYIQRAIAITLLRLV